MAKTLSYWNKNNEDNLTETLKKWQKAFNTPLEKFTEEKDLDWYGFYVIKDLKNPQSIWNYHVNNGPVDIVWAPKADINDKINVVAVYSDLEILKKESSSQLFLFAIYQGLPLVLVSMQNQGNEQSNFYLEETNSVSLYTIFHHVALI